MFPSERALKIYNELIPDKKIPIDSIEYVNILINEAKKLEKERMGTHGSNTDAK